VAVHHVAWCVADATQQLDLRERSEASGARVSPVKNRVYFESIYFREPWGRAHRNRDRGSGFLVDEPAKSLGEKAMPASWLDPIRESIERRLPPVHLNRNRMGTPGPIAASVRGPVLRAWSPLGLRACFARSGSPPSRPNIGTWMHTVGASWLNDHAGGVATAGRTGANRHHASVFLASVPAGALADSGGSPAACCSSPQSWMLGCCRQRWVC
jgi:hypothetical protein